MRETTHELGDTSGYEIRMKGHVAGHGAEWFEGMDVVQEPGGTTVIRCPALDQAALHGVLRTLRDLGLALISVTRMGTDGGPTGDAQPTTDLGSQRSL